MDKGLWLDDTRTSYDTVAVSYADKVHDRLAETPEEGAGEGEEGGPGVLGTAASRARLSPPQYPESPIHQIDTLMQTRYRQTGMLTHHSSCVPFHAALSTSAEARPVAPSSESVCSADSRRLLLQRPSVGVRNGSTRTSAALNGL